MYFAVDPINPAEAADELASIISASAAANWTALIDGAFDHGRSQCNYPGSPVALYACDELDALLEVSPLLIPLKIEHPSKLREQLLGLVRHCTGRPMFSVVASSGHAAELQPNWQKCARVMTDDGQKLLLRFADTRILPALPEILRPESWMALTRELSQWWYVNREGKLAQVEVANADSASVFPLAIGKREFNRLLERSEADSVIDAMAKRQPWILPGSNRAAFFERIRLVCAFARAHEIDAWPDVVALGIFDTLTTHRALTNPKLLKLVAERGWKQGELASKLVEIVE